MGGTRDHDWQGTGSIDGRVEKMLFTYKMPPKKKKRASVSTPLKKKELKKLVAALDVIGETVFGGTVHTRKNTKGVETGYSMGGFKKQNQDLHKEALKPGMAVFSMEDMSLWGTIMTVEKDTVTLDNNTKPLKKNRGEKWFAIRDEKYGVPMVWFVKLKLSGGMYWEYGDAVFVAVNHSIVDLLDKLVIPRGSSGESDEYELVEYKCIGVALPQDYEKGIIALSESRCGD